MSRDTTATFWARALMVMALALGLATAQADTAPAQAPDAALKATTEQIRGMIKAHYAEYKADQGKYYKAVDDVVVPRFDVPGIARLVLGVNYRSATPEQRERFAKSFKDMLVGSYANAMLDNYNSVNINWMPPRLAPNATDAAVNTSLTRDNGQSYAIGFRVHVVDGDWKIYDITVENVSLVLNFRTQINSEIKRTSLDDIIKRMESGQFKADAKEDGKSEGKQGQ
ncbi:MAG: ABC transporter substrate-binding protein [Nevskia sp.]|nr:ABC transporter substrate-binding protein [Nevskia sp.]